VRGQQRYNKLKQVWKYFSLPHEDFEGQLANIFVKINDIF